MEFEAHKNWVFKHPPGFSDNDITSYHCIQSTMNDFKLIVDLDDEDDDLKITKTFLMGDINAAIQLVADKKNADNSNITLLSPRYTNDGDYSVSDLVLVEKGEDSEGQDSYIYQCKDGRTYIDSSFANTIKDIKNKTTLYFKQQS